MASRAHRPGGLTFSGGPFGDDPNYVVDLSKFNPPDAEAISLLREAPRECSENAPRPDRCGNCWTCRIDSFLRRIGAR